MSANNWAVCPQCRHNLEVELESLKSSPLPIESEIIQITDSLNEMSDRHEGTLREDYEMGINETGLFYVYYNGACKLCGFIYSRKIKELVIKK